MSPKFQITGEELVETSPTSDFFLEVSRGNVSGVSFINKYGINPAIASTATPEYIWDNGGSLTWHTSNQSVEIVSASTNDASGGTGAKTVTVIGQNLAGTEQTETVSMNGTTAVALSNTYVIVYRAFVATAGTVGTNDGIVTIRVASAGATMATIAAGKGQTRVCHYRIPAGKTGYLMRGNSFAASKIGGGAVVEFYIRSNGGAWRNAGLVAPSSSGSSLATIVYPIPIALPALTDMYVIADVDTNNVGVGASYDIMLIDN